MNNTRFYATAALASYWKKAWILRIYRKWTFRMHELWQQTNTSQFFYLKHISTIANLQGHSGLLRLCVRVFALPRP